MNIKLLSNQNMTIKYQWASFIILICFAKSLIFYFDHLPMFFLGDSMSYITTALHGWIPPDRSFLYGFLIHLISVTTGSIFLLVGFQVFISCLTVIALVYCLQVFFRINMTLAFAMGFLFSLAPLQLFYERYVLTEVISLFILAIYLITAFKYLCGKKLLLLFIFQLVGTILIGFRLSFLPLIYFNTLLLPILAVYYIRENVCSQYADIEKHKNILLLYGVRLSEIFSHLVLSCLSLYIFHAGYQYLNGYLISRPPAYQYEDGLFLLADLNPVIRPVDFPSSELANAVYGGSKFDMNDRKTRGAQRWLPGGTVSLIKSSIKNPYEANRVAGNISRNAMIRDPMGVSKLAIDGFFDYWTIENLKTSMIIDRGGDRAFEAGFLKVMEQNFGINIDGFQKIRTVTNVYFYNAWSWYLLLLCLPLIVIGIYFFCSVNHRSKLVLIFVTVFSQVFILSLLIERPTIRYLHSLEFMFFIIIGLFLNKILALTNFSSDPVPLSKF